MKKKTWLTVIALAAIVAALIALVVLTLNELGFLPDEAENRLFVTGYRFLPVPVVGFLAGVLLQVFTVRRKSKKN